VLQILRQWTAGGKAETHVDRTNDVQEAWANLTRIYEGTDACGANTQKARQDIKEAKWVLNKHNRIALDNYCNTIQKANNELNRYNANVDVRTQVLDFLKGIRADRRVNPHLLSIKTTVLTSPKTMADLYKAVIMFKDTMRSTIGSSSDREQRQVSAAHHGNYSNYNARGNQNNFRGGRYGGRNPGRGFHRSVVKVDSQTIEVHEEFIVEDMIMAVKMTKPDDMCLFQETS
jgi:hypothetical protein